MIKNIVNLGDAAIYCDFGSEVNQEINSKVIKCFKILKDKNLKGVTNLSPSYNKLIVTFDLNETNYDYLKEEILNMSFNIKNEHRVHHQLRILQSAFKDLNTENTHPYLVGSEIDIKKVYKINRDYIVMCPTNSKYHKSNHRGYRAWPLKNWQELIDKVLSKTDLDIVVTGHSSEREFINQLNLNHSRVHNLSLIHI